MPDEFRTVTPLPAAQPPSAAVAGFHVLAKPIGPICNLDCKYCFYLEKEKLYPAGQKWKMSDEVLEAYIRQYIPAQDAPEIQFAWQGGEPTLMGVEFFQKAVELQRKYSGGKRITNGLQTNGTLLDDRWCAFLAEEKVLVGLSIDGPRPLHDRYRLDKQQQPTFDAVMRGLELLKKHKVEFNTLTVVNRDNSQQPLEVYRFLKQVGSGFMQFIPLVERMGQGDDVGLAAPPDAERECGDSSAVTPWSVLSRDYGQFLCAIFDQWVGRDVGRVFVQLFDVTLGNWMGTGSGLCVFAEHCGRALALEHNGDVYSCDHYVYPRYRLGNLLEQSPAEMVESPAQRKFAADKSDTLPAYCKACDVRFACQGECPKHRFMKTPDGQPGLNYLCPAYKRFFNHVAPHMQTMSELLRRRQPPALIMRMLAQQQTSGAGKPQRNAPCPCGSGKKFKNCCGAG